MQPPSHHVGAGRGNPAQHIETFFVRVREADPGRAAVIDVDDHRSDLAGDQAHDMLVLARRSNQESTAMVVDVDRRPRSGKRRSRGRPGDQAADRTVPGRYLNDLPLPHGLHGERDRRRLDEASGNAGEEPRLHPVDEGPTHALISAYFCSFRP